MSQPGYKPHRFGLFEDDDEVSIEHAPNNQGKITEALPQLVVDRSQFVPPDYNAEPEIYVNAPSTEPKSQYTQVEPRPMVTPNSGVQTGSTNSNKKPPPVPMNLIPICGSDSIFLNIGEM